MYWLQQVLTQEAEHQGRAIKVLDPMAGVGTVHELASAQIKTFGVELEPEWAATHPRTMIGDATKLPPRWKGRFDAVVTSPDYGNRMCDDFNASDKGEGRIGYRWALGRSPSPGSVIRHWGDEYRRLHLLVLAEMERVTRPGGLVVINVSDFIENKMRISVVQWYVDSLNELELAKVTDAEVPTPRMRKGQNGGARVDAEHVLVYRKADA